MRTEDGVFCDDDNKNCRKTATHVHMCKVCGAEFAFCRAHEEVFKALISGKPDLQIRCPRCIPQYLQSRSARRPERAPLPDPITGPLARAIDDAMFKSAILPPVRDQVLRRLAAIEDTYVAALFRSTREPAKDAS